MSGQELSLKFQVLEPKDQNLRTERKRHAVVDYVSQKRKVVDSTLSFNNSQVSNKNIIQNVQKRKALSNEELFLKIQLLESKAHKLLNEEVELKRLKDVRRKRKSREQLSDERFDQLKRQNRENKRLRRVNENAAQ